MQCLLKKFYTENLLKLKLFIVMLNSFNLKVIRQHITRAGDSKIILKQVQDKIWDNIQYKTLVLKLC